jgi:uncharacterized protein YfaS (alpha-2-macroglobulin family)
MYMRAKISSTLVLCWLLFSSGCGGILQDTSDNAAPSAAVEVPVTNVSEGLDVRLSSGAKAGDETQKPRVAPSTPLDVATINALLARAAPLPTDPTARTDFSFRESSLPPPRAGVTIVDGFASSTSAPPLVRTAPLTIERYSPEGQVPLAPFASVTFSEPMVAVGSHTEAIRDGIPVEISPLPEGQWRWLGTRTLVFDPAVRLPMATRYVVKVKADAKSLTGQQLAQPFSFEFTTPAPQLANQYPQGGSQPLTPIIVIQLDQKIDAERALAKVTLTAGERAFAVRRATKEEVQKDALAQSIIESAEAAGLTGRYLTLLPREPLPKGTDIRVTLQQGTPSAEGPLTTERDQSFDFRTFDPLAIAETSCGYGKCRPGNPWSFRFNNPLDEESFDPASIRIEPALPEAKMSVSGNYLTIQGVAAGDTRYQVTLPTTLRDVFGQVLGKDVQSSFNVGSAEPALLGRQIDPLILDPTVEQRSYSILSIGIPELIVRIRRVSPENWNEYLSRNAFSRNASARNALPGTLVVDQVIAVNGPKGRVAETRIDLTPALNAAGFGHALVTVEPKTWPNERDKPSRTTWVQATAIGLDSFVDREEMFAWATNLADGKPLADVQLELLPHRARQTTNATGLVRLPLTAEFIKNTPHMLIARRGQDVAFLPESVYYPVGETRGNSSGWYRQDPAASLAWFVYDDRQMYRPGESVNLKGWLRFYEPGKGGDITGLSARVPRVGWKVMDSQGNELAKGAASVNSFGGFHTSFKLPNTPNLGYATVQLTTPKSAQAPAGEYQHAFQIQEFRRPEFEVSTRASGGPYIVGAGADVTVNATYFSGGGLPAAPVEWNVTTSETQFIPPNRSDYTFGTWRPWWDFYRRERDSRRESFAAATGADGAHTLHLDFLTAKPASAMLVVANAIVTDVNRQAWSASETLLVHPSDVYVGLKRERYFVEKGQPIDIDLLVVDHAGNAVPGRSVLLQAFRLEREYKRGRLVETRTGLEECRVVSSASDQRCKLATKEGGIYQIEATVTDAANRPSQTSLQVWVTGGAVLSERDLKQETVTLIPDKQNYAEGDTVRLLVQAPFFPAEGLLTVRRSGVVTTQSFRLESATTVLDIPIREGYVPNVWAQVDLVGSAPRTDADGKPLADQPRRPAFAVGTLNLAVPPKQRTLTLEVVPAEKDVLPGAKTRLRVKVVDATGRAQPNVEVALAVVDEAVLALTGYKTPDPLAAFYGERGADTQDLHTRQWLELGRLDPEMLAANEVGMAVGSAMPAPTMMRMSMDKSAPGGGATAPIAVRKDFSAIAAFAPEQRTDADGVATLELKVPDNLTRYRIMAVAADQNRSFGSAEASFTARLPLMVRPSLPRFLNYGDRFELPVVLQNQTDQPMSVELAVRADNATVLAPAGQRVTVPARDRVEVRFPAGTEMPGTARFQMVAAAAGFTDAAQVTVPVRTPATTEAFATYGEIDSGAIQQQIRVPNDVVTTYGGLQVTTSSTQLAALTDAFLYLQTYPFDCSEQVASRLLSVAALRDVLSQFQVSGLPPKAEIDAAVVRDLARLAALQTYDGGFAFWSSNDESWPYISIHVGHALARAQLKGYPVSSATIERIASYLKNIEERIPAKYPAEIKPTLVAYALWVRKLLGDADPATARKVLAAGGDKLPIEALGWLLGVLGDDAKSQAEVTAILRRLGNQVTETAAAAHWVTSYTDGDYLLLHSSQRADAIILESLIRARPNDDLIPKIVRGLLREQRRGRWQNTQENVFALLAMDAYFAKYEKATPDMVARAWLGNQLAEEARFAGRKAERHHVEIPMKKLGAPGTEQPLIVGRTGAGRLYYRVGLTYAPKSLALAPAGQGFAVERRYEAVDDPSAVSRGDDGVWRIKAGALVRVHVSMVAESRHYHVALVDPLPAGLEAVNPDLAVTEPIPSEPPVTLGNGTGFFKGAGGMIASRTPFLSWIGPWYEHQNLRDDRVEAFTSVLREGVYEYTYVARATTPGTFIVPPAKAEEMYAPETFGRSASDRVVIE